MASTRWSTRAASSLVATLAACGSTAPVAAPTIENQAPATAPAGSCVEAAPACFPLHLTMVDLRGASYGAVELTDKLIVVTFWATWANPSKAEIPVFNQVFADYASGDVVILGINVDDIGDPELRKFAGDHRIAYPIVRIDKAIVEAFGMPDAVPRTLIYDRDGRLQDERTGTIGLDELATILQRLHAASD